MHSAAHLGRRGMIILGEVRRVVGEVSNLGRVPRGNLSWMQRLTTKEGRFASGGGGLGGV